jgi:hypothetical protein
MHGGSARSKAARRTALGRDYSLFAGVLDSSSACRYIASDALPRRNGPKRSWAIVCYATAIAGATAPHFQYQPVDPAHEIGDGLLDGVVGFLKLSLGTLAHRFAFTPARPPAAAATAPAFVFEV